MGNAAYAMVTELSRLGHEVTVFTPGSNVPAPEQARYGAGNSQMSIVLAASMTALLVHGLVDVQYFKNDLAIFFWMLVALSAIDDETQTTLS